jgi:hypothetical protein
MWIIPILSSWTGSSSETVYKSAKPALMTDRAQMICITDKYNKKAHQRRI